jgi:hypothetical protein
MNRIAAGTKLGEPAPLEAELKPRFDAEGWDEISDDDPVDCAVLCQSQWRRPVPGIDE